MNSFYYSSYEQELPALDYSSPASSSSYSASSTEWSTYLSPDSFQMTPGPAEVPAYFDYAPVKPEPATASPWEVYQPEPLRFPSAHPSSSLLLSPTYEEAAYPLRPSPSSTMLSVKPAVHRSPEPTLAEDIDDVVFARRRPATGQAPADHSHDVSPRNKQACVYCQSGRRKCDGNKNTLMACTVCAVAGRDCCWTKVKRLRGPNRARGDDGKPALPSSAYRVRSAGLLLKRIEEQQRQLQRPPAATCAPKVEAPAPAEVDDFIGADGWEPSSADGFQISSAVFVGAPESHAYPATPRPPTQALPSVLGLPYDHTAYCAGLPTPYDPSCATRPSAPEDDVRVRLDHFVFPRTAAPLTPPSVSSLPAAFDGRPGSGDAKPSLKRSRAPEDDGLWSHYAPAAKMNRALAIDIAGQRLSYAPAHEVAVF